MNDISVQYLDYIRVKGGGKSSTLGKNKDFLEEYTPMNVIQYFDRFGLFLNRDSSDENVLGEYSMYTGEGDPYKLSTIHSYDGKTEMNFWNDSQCNKVHGSDGASFNPYIKEVRHIALMIN